MMVNTSRRSHFVFILAAPLVEAWQSPSAQNILMVTSIVEY